MPATRMMKTFDCTNTDGQPVKVHRRCFGDGKLVQVQLAGMVYDEKAKKFRPAKKADVKTTMDGKAAAAKSQDRKSVAAE